MCVLEYAKQTSTDRRKSVCSTFCISTSTGREAEREDAKLREIVRRSCASDSDGRSGERRHRPAVLRSLALLPAVCDPEKNPTTSLSFHEKATANGKLTSCGILRSLESITTN